MQYTTGTHFSLMPECILRQSGNSRGLLQVVRPAIILIHFMLSPPLPLTF